MVPVPTGSSESGVAVQPCVYVFNIFPNRKLTFYLGNKTKATFKVRADGLHAPTKLGIAAIFIRPTGIITYIQLVAAFSHGWDAHIKL